MNIQSTKKIISSAQLQKPILIQSLETQLNVIINHIEDSIDESNKKFIFLICHDKTNEQAEWYVQLYDLHKSIPIQIGDELFLKGIFIDRILKIESLGENLMVCLPQVNISPSELSDSQCERKIVISQEFKNQAYGTALPILLGQIGHDFYQYLINNESNFIGLMSEIPYLQQWKETNPLPPNFQDQYTDIYEKYIKECYYLKQDYQTLLKNSFDMLRNIINWIDKHIYRKELLVIKNYKIQFLKLVEIEKNLESKYFGFQGFLDVIMRVSIQKNNDPAIVCNIPIELKCGKKYKDDYIQQTRIYMMMMQDQNPVDAPIGLLHYVLMEEIQLITITSAREKEYIHFHRNKYVYQKQGQLKDLGILDFPRSQNSCTYCDHVDTCAALNMIYQNADPPECFTKYFEVQSKLKEKSLNYLQNWINILQLEERYLKKPKYEFKIIKTYISDEILILTSTTNQNQAQQFIDEYNGQTNLILVKNKTEYKVSILFLKLEPCIQTITTNSQGGLYQIYLKIQSPQGKQLQQFESIHLKMDVNYNQFHYKGLRSVMVQLVTMDQFEKKKDILVFSIEPKFTSPGPEDSRLQALDILNFKFKKLNKDQSNAIKLCLEAEDLALILGFPGTGKTHTIVHLLYLLGYVNKKVLICSQNHNAVDNILEKFIKTFPLQDNWIARLGTDSKVFSDISRKYHLDLSSLKSIENINKVMSEKRLYFSTCHQYKDLVQQESKFDYCIIDEASQMVEPLCIASLLKSKVFILVGDYKQLQPIVMNPKVEDKLGVSLIERLDKKFNCSAKLTLQYRMNQQIMMVANELVYENQLKLFDVGQTKGLNLKEGITEMEKLISSESVMFLNCESQQKELNVVREVVNSLLTIGVDKTEIAIIATYNKLIEDIKKNFNNKLDIKIMTIDKSQGIDFECIIVVCSQENKNDKHLLENIKRINVACTRAKQKLIIVGNGEYLKQFECMNKLLELLEKQKWVHQME